MAQTRKKSPAEILRSRMLKAKPVRVESVTLPDGETLHYRVLPFGDVNDVLAEIAEAQEGTREDRVDVMGKLVVRALCDPEGKPFLKDGDHTALFKAMDSDSYVTLSAAVQRAYKLVPVEEVAEDLKETPGDT